MSCIRANIPITIVEGGTFDKTFQWKTGDPAVAVDLTGFTGVMTIRAKLADVVALQSVPNDAGPWVADADTGIYIYDQSVPADVGKVRAYIKDDDTLGMCAAHKDIAGVYDLFLYSPAGEAVLQIYGVATMIAAVTR